jgi:hypothetical protein
MKRPQVTNDEVDAVMAQIRERMLEHADQYGRGIFIHPHEVVGCMTGQLRKLSEAADASIYKSAFDEPFADFSERVQKMLIPLIFTLAGIPKMVEDRGPL